MEKLTRYERGGVNWSLRNELKIGAGDLSSEIIQWIEEGEEGVKRKYDGEICTLRDDAKLTELGVKNSKQRNEWEIEKWRRMKQRKLGSQKFV